MNEEQLEALNEMRNVMLAVADMLNKAVANYDRAMVSKPIDGWNMFIDIDGLLQRGRFVGEETK